MRKKQKRHNDIDDTIHGLASALLHIGAIEKQTMRRFDKNALTPVHAFTPKQFRALRERENVGQSVLTDHLHVSTDFIANVSGESADPMAGR